MHVLSCSCTVTYKFPLLDTFQVWLMQLCLPVMPGLILMLIAHLYQVTTLLLYNQAPGGCDTPTR